VVFAWFRDPVFELCKALSGLCGGEGVGGVGAGEGGVEAGVVGGVGVGAGGRPVVCASITGDITDYKVRHRYGRYYYMRICV
jgi:hypothetical protein